MLRILLADDDPDFLEEFADYFRYSTLDQHEFEIVALCQNGEEALAGLDKHQPQLALLDIDMPGFNGIEVAQQAKELSPASKVLIWSCHASFTSFDDLAEAGVQAYLVKPFAFGALESALRAVLQNDVWFDPLMTKHTYKRLLKATNEDLNSQQIDANL